MATKIRSRQPARIPFGPTKILPGSGCCAARRGSLPAKTGSVCSGSIFTFVSDVLYTLRSKVCVSFSIVSLPADAQVYFQQVGSARFISCKMERNRRASPKKSRKVGLRSSRTGDARLILAKIIRRFAFVRRHTSLRGIELGKGYERHGKHHKIDGAAFGADGPASEPARTVKTGIQEVASSEQAAIRSGKDEGFGIISRGMKADCKPEISGTSQRKAGKKAEKCHRKRSDPSFSRVTYMNRAERCGKQNR